MYWISLALGCICFGTLPSWIEMVAPSAETNILLRMPVGVGRAKGIAFQLAGVNDLRRDGLGGERRPQQMRDAAAGGERDGDR